MESRKTDYMLVQWINIISEEKLWSTFTFTLFSYLSAIWKKHVLRPPQLYYVTINPLFFLDSLQTFLSCWNVGLFKTGSVEIWKNLSRPPQLYYVIIILLFFSFLILYSWPHLVGMPVSWNRGGSNMATPFCDRCKIIVLQWTLSSSWFHTVSPILLQCCV